MVAAIEFDEVDSTLRIWHAYDPAAKAELFSTAINTGTSTFIVDPIPFAGKPLEGWPNVAAIVVTNTNHQRASAEFSERFKVPIFAGAESFDDVQLNAVAIDGAAPDEIALCVNQSLIMGDALINFEPHGFTFLPAKYCTNFKRMRQSLRQLLDLDFERILFAHGIPITSRAHERLAQLLNE
jgi:glyoxylase-like metal-dependent hydrolase (beta-lactamase superfamily II)